MVLHVYYIYLVILQISLIDVPEYRRRKAMALSPNIMRDTSDKVSCVTYVSCLDLLEGGRIH